MLAFLNFIHTDKQNRFTLFLHGIWHPCETDEDITIEKYLSFYQAEGFSITLHYIAMTVYIKTLDMYNILTTMEEAENTSCD